jgi:two-component system sensor kinase FixL
MRVARLTAVGELNMALAHELNQPLGAIVNHLSAAKYLVGKDGPVARAHLLQAITDATEQSMRAGAILKRLRTFIEKGEADKRLEAASTIVAEAVALLTSAIRKRGIELKIEIHAGDLSVLADRVQIQQVLFNLLRNAMEALDAPGLEKRQLTISTQSAASGNVEIVVRDTGPGVNADKARNLFLPFLSDKSDGMGVGLAISKRIVEAHGGQLTYEPAKGSGAAFRLTLPAPFPEEMIDE